MRLAVVQTELFWDGGAERVLNQVLSRLKKKHEIKLFTLNFQPSTYETLNNLDRYESHTRKSLSGHFVRYYEKKEYTDMARAIKKWAPDVVLVNKQFMYVKWLSEKTRRPVVLYLHGGQDLVRMLKAGRKKGHVRRNPIARIYGEMTDVAAVNSLSLDGARLVICVCRAAEKVIHDNFPGVPTKVVYNAVDHKWFSPTWEDGNYVLSVSRFSPEKNVELVMEALGGARYPLIVHGNLGPGPAEKRSRAYLERLKSLSTSNIKIEIHEDDASMRRLVQRCSVFVNPGKDEGFPLTILEAMSCGKPVVAHNSGGTPECVDGAGFLLGDDPLEWRAKVDELMNSAELRKEWGKRAYEYSKDYDWDRTANEIEEALESVAPSTR